MTTSIKEKITSGGYWRVQLRPSESDFLENRINLPELSDKIENSRVSLRGWDYPHFRNGDEKNVSDNKIYYEDEFEGHIECFEFTTSGQFVHLSSFVEDYAVSPEKLEQVKSSIVFNKDQLKDVTRLLEIVSIIFRFTEIFLFASKLVQNREFDKVENIEFNIELHGIKGRMLFFWESMRHLSMPYICWYEDDKTSINLTISKEDLIAEYDRFARESIIKIFNRFGWKDPNESIIKDDQKRLIERRI